MMIRGGFAPGFKAIASTAYGALRNIPDSEENSSRSGNDTEIQASARPKEESTGSRASRFGNAKAAMSARTLICGELWWTLWVTLRARVDCAGRGPSSGISNAPRLSKSESRVPPKPRWDKRILA